MKAVVLYGPGDLRIADFPEPPMTDTGVKIAVSYCGLCGTDFHKFAGKAGSRPVTYPVPLGHEISGIVVETGSTVSGFRKGDRVTVDPNWSCGHCRYCKTGKSHLCENSRGVVKGLAQYVCPPQENVYHIPDHLSLRHAALTEPLSCCLHGIDLLDVKLGDTVAIVGFGAIGQLMLQLCRNASAASIIVVEPVEEKRELAMSLGADLFVNPVKEDPVEAIRTAHIAGVDKVIECGGIPETAQLALRIADRGATVVLFGVADPDAVLPIRQYDIFQKELTIKASYINPATTQRAIALLASGAVDVDASVSCVLKPEAVVEEIKTRAFSRLGKVLVCMADSEKDPCVVPDAET